MIKILNCNQPLQYTLLLLIQGLGYYAGFGIKNLQYTLLLLIRLRFFVLFRSQLYLQYTLVSSIGYIFFQISNQLFLLYFNFKIGFFKSLFIRSAYTTWSTTSEIVVILCPASLEDAPQWYILCLSVFQSMIIYLSWNSPPDF